MARSAKGRRWQFGCSSPLAFVFLFCTHSWRVTFISAGLFDVMLTCFAWSAFSHGCLEQVKHSWLNWERIEEAAIMAWLPVRIWQEMVYLQLYLRHGVTPAPLFSDDPSGWYDRYSFFRRVKPGEVSSQGPGRFLKMKTPLLAF